VRVFLDANVLFSMALGGPVLKAILEVAKRGRLHLLTSAFCYLEAWRNVELKVPEKRQALEGILEWVRLVPEAGWRTYCRKRTCPFWRRRWRPGPPTSLPGTCATSHPS
jgi:hypothetical protein